MDAEMIRNNLKEVCRRNPKAKIVFKKTNGQHEYKVLARMADLNPSVCSTILNKGHNLQLLEKLKLYFLREKKLFQVLQLIRLTKMVL